DRATVGLVRAGATGRGSSAVATFSVFRCHGTAELSGSLARGRSRGATSTLSSQKVIPISRYIVVAVVRCSSAFTQSPIRQIGGGQAQDHTRKDRVGTYKRPTFPPVAESRASDDCQDALAPPGS